MAHYRRRRRRRRSRKWLSPYPFSSYKFTNYLFKKLFIGKSHIDKKEHVSIFLKKNKYVENVVNLHPSSPAAFVCLPLKKGNGFSSPFLFFFFMSPAAPPDHNSTITAGSGGRPASASAFAYISGGHLGRRFDTWRWPETRIK